MRFWPRILLLLLGSTSVWGQADSNEVLPEATIAELRIRPDRSLKELSYNADSLNIGNRQTLAEALKYQSSIFVKSYGGNGVATLSLRGTGASHTRLFWNNLELGSPMLGLADLSLLPLSGFDNLNLQYGFASLVDGSGALGGSLRLQNRPGMGQQSRIELQQMAGSFGRYQTSVSAKIGEGRFRSETHAYQFQAENDFSYPDITREGWPVERMQNADLLQRGIQQSFYYRLSENEMLSLKSWYNFTERKLPPPITGNPGNFDELLDESITAIVEYQKATGKFKWLVNSGLIKSDNIFRNRQIERKSNNSFLSWQNNIRVQYDHSDRLNSEHGLSGRWEHAISPSYQASASRGQISAFSRWNYDFQENAGLRLLLRQELVEDNLSPLLGSLGMFWKLSTKQLLRINLARNYRFPTLNDLYWQPGGNPNLKAEESWSFEAGYRREFAISSNFRQQFSATTFYNLVDNWIQWVPRGNFTSPANLKKVVNAGLEIESRGSFEWADWQFSNSLSYAYTRSRAVEVYAGGIKAGQLSYVPFHKFNIGVAAERGLWHFRYQQNFSSRYFTTASNDVYMPAFQLASASVAYQDLLPAEKHQLSIGLTIQNLYDLPYQLLPYRPEPGFQFSIKLSYRLGL